MNGAGAGQAGGNQGQVQYAKDPVYAADLFDPEAPLGSQWTTLAPASNMRLYHSGVILLESGHVVTTGSEMDNYNDYWVDKNMNCRPAVDQAACASPFNYNIERFTPPYLQRAARNGRPMIPSSLPYQSTFQVELQGPASSVSKFTLTRPDMSLGGPQAWQRLIKPIPTNDWLNCES